MDAALGFFFVMLTLLLFFLGLAYAYRNLNVIKAWLNTPYYANEDRRLRLRRRIEDAEKEIEELDKAETDPK